RPRLHRRGTRRHRRTRRPVASAGESGPPAARGPGPALLRAPLRRGDRHDARRLPRHRAQPGGPRPGPAPRRVERGRTGSHVRRRVMNNGLERRLAAVIEDQIRDLPEPPSALFDTITRGAVRRRRRTRLVRAAAVGVAALALVGAVALVPVLHAGPGPTTVGTPSASASASPSVSAPTSSGSATPSRTTGIVPPASADRLPDFGAAKPIAQVWPKAVVNLPMTVN